MSQTRLWILLLTGVAFMAGIGTGILVQERAHRKSLVESAFGDFERAFTDQFELDLEGQRLLAGYLGHYNRETEEILERYAAEHHREMEPELRKAGLEYRERLRERVLLDHKQRIEFDRSMANFVENL